MALSIEELSQISRYFDPIYGKKAWDVRLGVGSFITMNFGQSIPIEGRNKKDRGEWHLWIYHSAWQIEDNGQVLVGSEDSRESLQKVVSLLEGRTLESIMINPGSFNTSFYFEKGFTLHTFPLSFLEEYEHWMLFTQDNTVLVTGPGLNWIYKNAKKT